MPGISGEFTLRIREVDLRNTKKWLDDRSKEAQQVFGDVVARDAQNYVPLRDGPLRGSNRVENGGKQVTWEAYSNRGYPYGVRQFRVQFSNYTTPGTGPRWDQKAEAGHYSSWVQEVGAVFN